MPPKPVIGALCARRVHHECVSPLCECSCHHGSSERPALAEAQQVRDKSQAVAVHRPPADNGKALTTMTSITFGGAPRIPSGPGRLPEWERQLRVIVDNIEGFTEQPGVWAKLKTYEKVSTARTTADSLRRFRLWAEQVGDERPADAGAWEFYGEKIGDGKTAAGALWARYNPDGRE